LRLSSQHRARSIQLKSGIQPLREICFQHLKQRNLQGIQKHPVRLPIIVFTDHKNNTFNGLKASDRGLRWLLLLEEYGVTFEYLPEKKQKIVDALADVLSRLDIDGLNIQEEEVLTLLSGSENNSIINIEFPMHTTLIFKEQAKVKGLREKGLAQPHYSIKHIEGYDLLGCKDNKQDLHSSIIETENKEYCPGTMNIYFIRDRLDSKRLSGIP
jgi:hypothetical protein